MENSALGIFIHHLSNFRQKIDRVLSAGLVARVQAARLGLTGVLLGLASKQTFHFMMRVGKDIPILRNGSSENFPDDCPQGWRRAEKPPAAQADWRKRAPSRRNKLLRLFPGTAKIC
ncbi:hypothetical protein [Caballeronia sp. ATUFL_M2_KS44]|uniref:hypothetical protein n=1 Tax=Caballeronia sp. ATUFL_M2_KS44 TaxID=2921767 RepID=UPI0020287EF9|nr:hypothetical protein [Caballeronia sp. ATUFL_M2_KS44]